MLKQDFQIPRSPFLLSMQERGAINQCTNLSGLDDKLMEGRTTAFVGFDATADSLHVGHLVSLIAMRRLAAAGHQVIALLGGATTLVGDPSFRNSTRPMLSSDQISLNMAGIRRNIETVIGEHSDNLLIVDNHVWLGEARLIEFMRNVGVHFTIARMLSVEAVKTRLESGLTMLEFCYMMLQATDFLELNRRHGCLLQMGGSDQWGNIINGVELARRSDATELFGLTTPLLTTANGEKMGKTANGAVWLSPEKLSDFEFWQFWRNVDDANVATLLRLLTDIPIQQVDDAATSNINEAKAMLANWVTSLVRGKDAASQAEQKAHALFSNADMVEPRDLQIEGDEVGILTLLCEAGLCTTKNEGRRLVEGGGVRIDGIQVSDPRLKLTMGQAFQISVGKRKREFLRLI